MEKKMTWEEMKKAFPDEWLLITEFETDESGHLLSGIVERHSPEMEEIAMPPALNVPTAFRYTGESTFRGLRRYAKHDYHI